MNKILFAPLRLCVNLFFILFCLPMFTFAQNATELPAQDATELPAQNAAELPEPHIEKEAPAEIMGFSLGDSDVSLFLTGFWKGSLQTNLGYSFSPLGDAPVSPETPLLFTQEVDLTLSLWLKEKWFVEASFQDDSSLNTYRAGYQGRAGDFVQYAGIGNTGLDFPSFAYLDLGGDSPSSFGYYGHFISGNFNIYSLFRYDAAAREEKVFTGGRERTYSFIQPDNPVRGISFVLPDTDIDSDILVYIEDETGSIRADAPNGGRRWRLAGPSEFAAGRTHGLLELGSQPNGMVAVVYSKGGSTRPWDASMGNYNGASGDFLFDVQQWFDTVKLENYPQCGNGRGLSARPGEVSFNSTPALVVFEPGTFSPFERQSRYESPSSMSEEAALVRFSTGGTVREFELVSLDSGIRVSDIPVFTAVETRRFLYELLDARMSYDSRDPSSRWPLAQYPDTTHLDTSYLDIYLPGKTGFTGDVALRFTNFSGSGGYSIGVDVIPGSIQVWRSGIQDPNFRYNPSSGEISLSVPAGANELIRVTYLKRSDETRLGSVAAGLGAVYNKPSSPFSLSTAMGIRWNLTGDSSFSEEDVSSPGTIGFSAKAALEYDNLKTHVSAGLAFEQQDTTGLYRAAGMEGNEIVLAMPPQTSFISNPPAAIPPNTALDISSRADLVYRNYRNSNIAGSTLMAIDWGGSSIVSGQSKPYTARDPLLGSDTQVMVAEFTLNDSRKWTGFQIPLGFDVAVLAGSREIEIPFRFYGFNLNEQANFKLTVQIGSLSGEDFAFNENIELVWERTLFEDGWASQPNVNDWVTIPAVSDNYYLNTGFNHNSRIARFVLTDEDRLKLGDAKYLRIIVEYDGSGAGEARGRVLLAPPVVRGASFRAVTFNGRSVQSAADFSNASQNNVTVLETIEREPDFLESAYGDLIKRLHSAGGKQRVLKIEWEKMQSGISAGADGRLGALPLENYRELSFFVKGPQESAVKNGKLSFIIAPGPASVSDSELEAHIPLNVFPAGKWSKVTIRYRGNNTGVMIDGRDEADAVFRYRPSYRQSAQTHITGDETPKGRAGYAVFLVTPDEAAALEAGSICIDEVILEDASLVYRLNAGAGAEFKKTGTMFSLGNTPLLADLLISAALESEFRGDPIDEASQIDGSMMNRSRAEITVLGAKITGNLALTAAKDTFLWSADHVISRDIGPFSIKESFFASPSQDSAGHSVKLGFTSPFSANFGADMKQEFSRLERKWNLGFGFKAANVYIPSFSVNTSAAWTNRDDKIDENENYGNLWVRTWEPLLPDAGADADGRRTSAQITLTEAAKPIGFIITLNGSTDFFNANNITRSENSAFLDVPVSFDKTSFNFRMGRSFSKHLSFSGDDAADDGEKFLESIADSLPLWRVAPFHSLFSGELNSAMDESHKSSQSFDSALYSSFRDHFGIRAAFPSVYNLAAFVVPSTVTFRMERVLEQKLDTRADTLNIGSGLGFSAINMFGVMGYFPFFKFYRSDEFTNGLEAAFIIPREEEASWRLQAVTGAGFYGFSGGQLSFTNTLTLRSDESWLESVKGEWTVPVKKSLLSVFYGWIAKTVEKQNSLAGLSSLLKKDFEQLRCESVEFSVERYKNYLKDDYTRWKLSLGHESIVRILGRLNLSAFAKLNFSEESQLKHPAPLKQMSQLEQMSQNEMIAFDALLGITLRVSF